MTNNEIALNFKNKGNEFASQQDWVNAEKFYKKALSVAPNYLDALNNITGVMACTNRMEEASKYSKRILEIDSSNIAIRINLAKMSLDIGNIEDAEEYSKEILEIKNDDVFALKTLALSSENKARRLTDDISKLKTAEDLIASKKINQAKLAYKKVIDTSPEDLSSTYRYFNILIEQKKNDDATQLLVLLKNNKKIPSEFTVALEKIANIKNEMPEDINYNSLSKVATEHYEDLVKNMLELGHNEQAILFQKKIIEISPNSPDALNKLGKMLETLGNLVAAERQYRIILSIDSNHIDALCNLGNLLRVQENTAEMIEIYKKVLMISPTHSIAIRAAMSSNAIYNSTNEINNFRQNLEKTLSYLESLEYRITDPIKEIATTNFYLSYHGKDNLSIQKRFANFFIKACPSLTWRSPHLTNYKRDPEKKIKIGFYSKHMKLHTVGHLMLGILENISKDKFETYIYSPAASKADEISTRISEKANRYIKLPNDLNIARKTISSHELDIMFYPDIGMEPFSYFLAFSKLAEVQCVFWGHPETTGIPNMDYFISSEDLETKENAEANYSEKLLKTKNFLSYYYYPDMPINFYGREKLGLPKDKKLYVCVQSLFKIHPDFDQILNSILEKDKNALIVFIGNSTNWNELLMKRFSENIPEHSNRIAFTPRLNTEHFMSLLKMADVLLDPIYFSGGKTSFESLAVGNLVVTLPDRFMRSRITDAYYKTLDVAELTAKDEKDYVEIAYRIANDFEYKEKILTKIKHKLNLNLSKNAAEASKVFFNIDAIRELEDFFEQALSN
ncbi:MAG: hypothetical protein GY804_12305 [Alphaproteobacteria bacterium]|nr:hypothetical protein [Alphaproteobacteria bacterium]